MASASFWRGSWYLLDEVVFPENVLHSALASLAGGTLGMAACQGLVHRADRAVLPKPVARIGALYALATSCVLVWRGTWLLWDVIYENCYYALYDEEVSSTDQGHLSQSGLLSHVTAVSGLVACGLFASVLAPPAAVSVLRDASLTAGKRITSSALKRNNVYISPSLLKRGLVTSAPRQTMSRPPDLIRSSMNRERYPQRQTRWY
jgi:hypothetical protein